MASGPLILDVRDLRLELETYRGIAQILDGVSLQIRRAESVGLVGESGCGKSLTAKLILRLLRIPLFRVTSGEVWFEGRDLLTLAEEELLGIRGKRIALIPQDPMTSLNPVFTVGEQMVDLMVWQGQKRVRRGPLAARQEREVAEHKALEMLASMRIPSPELILKRYPIELSGGMRQRVLIAMALLGNPDLLLADEPGTALDVTVQDKINQLIRERVAARGLSMLYITHDLGVAKRLCDRINVMYAGRVVESSPTTRLFREPLHPYTVGLLESVPKLTGTIASGIPGMVPDYVKPPLGCRFHPRCPHKMDVCDHVVPPLLEERSGHTVACHLYPEGGGQSG